MNITGRSALPAVAVAAGFGLFAFVPHLAPDLSAQEPGSGTVLRGSVVDAAGDPVAGADVFLLETLEGAATGGDGAFLLETAYRGAAVLVVRGEGFEAVRVPVSLPRASPVEVVVDLRVVPIEPIRVRAGAYRMGAGEAESLTPLDVVTTPGANADVLQAVGALPGVQPVEEGAALYVRGGDVAETKVVLDGAVVLAPYRFESGLLSFGTFDPFELEGIAFSSGGFGARHGDALSALLELETAGVPERRDAALTGSLGALAARVSVPVGDDLGIRLAGNRSSTGFMFRLNGHDTDFVRVPESRNGSGSVSWEYRRGGRVKLYAYDEWNRFSVLVDDPAHEGAFTGNDASGLWVLSLRDVSGPLSVRASLSGSRRTQRQEFGAFRLTESDRYYQLRVEASGELQPGLVVRSGGEAERRVARVAGAYPEEAVDLHPDASSTIFDSRVEGDRWAAFGEAEWRPSTAVQVTAGVRRDAATLPGRATWDPRLAAVLRVTDDIHLTGAWGIYHQVAAPLAYEETVGDPSLPSMMSRHLVAGLVARGERGLLRIEAYHRRDEGLVQTDRSYDTEGGGRGTARGLDLFVRGRGPLGLEGRASYSFIDASRTDPNTGTLARSPYEIRHSLRLVLERGFGGSFRLGGTLRLATGRPYTPVVDAVRDDAAGVWRPVYGAPQSRRLPTYARLDLTGQYLHSFGGDDLAVLFVSITNVLDRKNIAAIRYSDDYSETEPQPAAFRRTVYFGVSLTLPF
jgi:hypothetical protein